jgi:protein TonB
VIADHRLLACAAISLVGHVAFERWLERLPPSPVTSSRKVEIQVIVPTPTATEPEPEPVKAPEPPPPEPARRPVHERPRARPVVADRQADTPKDTPPSELPPTSNTADTSATPVFGVTMESTSQAGNGPAIPIGNSPRPRAASGPVAPPAVKPLAEPVAMYQVTKMPLPEGRCVGKYTEEARDAAVEGTVTLDLIVGEDGRTREIRVVEGLPHGLSRAAVTALNECRFTPGEKDGKAVPVRVRGFKIRFVLQENK